MVSRTEMVKAYSNLLEHLKSKAQRRMPAKGVPSQERATIQVHVNMLETTKQVMTEKRHLASAKKRGKEFKATKNLNVNLIFKRSEKAKMMRLKE